MSDDSDAVMQERSLKDEGSSPKFVGGKAICLGQGSQNMQVDRA